MKTRNVNKGSEGLNVDPAKYEAVKEAILRSMPAGSKPVTFLELTKKVSKNVDRSRFSGSIPWYSKVVQLDLEARRLLRRIPGRPLRFERAG